MVKFSSAFSTRAMSPVRIPFHHFPLVSGTKLVRVRSLFPAPRSIAQWVSRAHLRFRCTDTQRLFLASFSPTPYPQRLAGAGDARHGQSRKTIYGASVRAASEKAAHSRKDADRLACEAWIKRMLAFKGPQPGPCDVAAEKITQATRHHRGGPVRAEDSDALQGAPVFTCVLKTQDASRKNVAPARLSATVTKVRQTRSVSKVSLHALNCNLGIWNETGNEKVCTSCCWDLDDVR
jgi:hypothetical protein